jgi:predicted nucleic acid-binding protein
MIFLDSSALVKRYVEEPGSESLDRLLRAHPYVAVSRLAWPEILSALFRKHKARELSAATLARLEAAFESDWNRLFVLEFADELLPTVRETIRRHAIRGADAVHLASAMWLRSVLKEDVTFVCSDSKLLDAARKERLLPFDPAALPG